MQRNFLRFGISLIFAGFGAAMFLTSCNDDPKDPGLEYMPDMYRSPSYETYSINPNFKDSMTARRPVVGTIPRGNTYMPYPYPNTPEGYEAAGREWKNPFEKTEENIAEGKRLYEIFCIHCHGPQGQGDGSVIASGRFPPPPKYNDQLKDLPEGKMFHTITYGKNLMGSHASQVNQVERWKIIMYVQTLQKLNTNGAVASADSTAKK